jgi:anti-sigma-K factor RskA
MSDHLRPDEFIELEKLLTELTTQDIDLVESPEGLWNDIEAEAMGAIGIRPTQSFVYDEESVASQSESNVVSLDSRRKFSRSLPVLAIAAATVAVVGTVGILLANNTNEPTIVATADLEYDPRSFDELGTSADATVLLVDDDGQSVIKIDQSSLPDTTGSEEDLELWLIEPDAAGQPANLISLGLIDPVNPGEFAVPDGFDPSVYFVVDISVEPRDGNEAHSGRSILRGPLGDA